MIFRIFFEDRVSGNPGYVILDFGRHRTNGFQIFTTEPGYIKVCLVPTPLLARFRARSGGVAMRVLIAEKLIIWFFSS
jgi:hypothetical protein